MQIAAAAGPGAIRVPSPAMRWAGALERTARIGQDPARTLPLVIDELAERHGGAPALIGERETLSFRELGARSRRYARWALSHGLGHGDVVALLMPNRPDYLAVWLGLSRVGVTVALVNANLTGASLAHSIGLVQPKAAIVAAELLPGLESLAADLPRGMQVWAHGKGGAAHPRIDEAITMFDAGPLPDGETRPAILTDRALLIYTSGTTSLPKAANVSHGRVMMWTHWFAGLLGTTPADRLYNCLPMYHSVGGVVATGSALVGGGCVIIRQRFSATRFWDDVADTECTLFQYIGELCRYLLRAPEAPRERSHRLRIATGNGLRADVWTPFQERFAIPRILEFYAATENTVSLYNVEGRVGAVGRVPPVLAHRSPAALIRVDEAGEPLRGPDGLCIRAPVGETGELVGRLDPAKATQTFEGYTGDAESRRKVLRDVSAPGDAWLRSGDLMHTDAQGFFFFADRLGDTFRWKGENVATTEVEAAVAAVPGVIEALVYGVDVPGAEGRAGMAALRVEPDFDLAHLREHLGANLPRYARPLFIRIVDDFERTETFKPKKRPLAEQGFDPARGVADVFYDDPDQQAYVPLDDVLAVRIRTGTIRL